MMRSQLAKLFAIATLALGTLALGGCASNVELPTYADITFKSSSPIPLAIGSVSSEIAYVDPLTTPHVGHEFPVSLPETAARWAQDRIQPVASGGTFSLIVLEASAVEAELETKKGITGLVTDDQAQLYTATVSATLKAEDASGLNAAETTVKVSRSRSVPEGASFNERERIWYQLSEEVMADYNTALEQAVQTHMTRFQPS